MVEKEIKKRKEKRKTVMLTNGHKKESDLSFWPLPRQH